MNEVAEKALTFAGQSLEDACLCEALAKRDRACAYDRNTDSAHAADDLVAAYARVARVASLVKASA